MEVSPGSSTPDKTIEQVQEEAPKMGPLLDEDDEKKVKAAVLKHWKDQDRALSYQTCEVEQAEFWRNGERWVFIRPADDDQQHEIWRPSGIERLGRMPQTVDQLIRRLIAQLLVDPPSLEAEALDGSEQFKSAADLTTRIFEAEGSSEAWDLRSILEGALDISTTAKSAFAHVLVNPTGGGERPVTVLASPVATHYDPNQPDACLMEPGPAVAVAPGMPPQPGPPVMTANKVKRYVSNDFSLTEHETTETMKRWVPWPQIALLGFRNVRFLPEWCRGVDDADGLLVADYLPIGTLKALYPETVGQMDDHDLRTLVNWKPIPKARLLPSFARDPQKVGTRLSSDKVPDDAVALVIWEYHQQSPAYPKGCAVAIGGTDELLCQDTLEVAVEQRHGGSVYRVLKPPVAQCRCLNDWIGMRPHGTALVTKLGPWAELHGQQWQAVMDWLDRWNHPHQFLPLGSAVQPEQMAMRTGEPILVNPEGTPSTENVPAIPRDVKEFLDRSSAGMDKEALLSEVAQGLETPNITSGAQAQFTAHTALVALSSLQQNATNFIVALGSLLLERLQAYMSVPRAVEYLGDDGAFKADEWRSVDLTGVKGMRLKRGTFTLMSPDLKKRRLLEDVAAHVISLDDAIDQIAAQTRSTFGLADDPVRLRIKRQISACIHEGTPFDGSPIDLIQSVAAQRFRELAKTLMGVGWMAQCPIPLRQKVQGLLTQEAERMRQAAGLHTLAEQSQAKQQADMAGAKREVEIESGIAAGKARAESGKSEQEILKELRADIILLATKAGIDPKNPSNAAAELLQGVLGLDAAALGIIHPAPATPPLPSPAAPPPHLRLVKPPAGAPPATSAVPHTPAQIVPKPGVPSPLRS